MVIGTRSTTSNEEEVMTVETAVNTVSQQKEKWATLGDEQKMVLIDEIMNIMRDETDTFHAMAVAKRGYRPDFVSNDYKAFLRSASSIEDSNIKGKVGLDHVTKGTVSTGGGEKTDASSSNMESKATLSHSSSLPDPKSITDLSTVNGGLLSNSAANILYWQHTSLLLNLWLSTLYDYYYSLVHTKRAPPPLGTYKNLDGSTRVKVGPSGALLNMIFSFGSVELYLSDDKVTQNLHSTKPAGVGVVLGAGNFDAHIDLLHCLFVDNKVCVYKFNPLSDILAHVSRRIFAPLITEGYLVMIEGGADVGRDLVFNSKVDMWMMTGSVRTANAIVWGSIEGPKDKSATPLVNKSNLLELGNVTPWIICPGVWAVGDLQRYAAYIASCMLFNGGHICVHPQVIITCKNWPQREEFIKYIKESLKESSIVGCFYPGYSTWITKSIDKLKAEGKSEEDFIINTPVGISAKFQETDTSQNVIFASDINHDSFLCSEESFCPVSGELAIDAEATIPEFLSAAVKFANEKIWGTLSCSITVRTRNKADEVALEQAILDLKYGSVNINCDPRTSITVPSLLWGGYPGATLYDMQSGIGQMGNCFGYANAVKSVCRVPFFNMSLMVLNLPNRSNYTRMAKMWKRMSHAAHERRPTQRSLYSAYELMKISTALVCNI